MLLNPGLLLIAAIAYLIGCIPTGLILLRLWHKKDIREEGTGNVGAMNAFDVTGSKLTGALTFLIDALKGAAAILVARAIHGDWFAATAWAGTFVVLGHNYNAFLKGKGGRGLATGTGVFALVTPLAVVTWWITYFIGYYAIRRHVHVGSMAATIATAALFWSIPNRAIIDSTLVPITDPTLVRYMVSAIAVVIFLRHVQPIRDLLGEDEGSAGGAEKP